ncbi:MAG: hypothetical protein WCI21_05785 [Alphaproteobacteria bacterium]
MPKISLAFFTVAPIYVIIGMVWGMVMGASGDHSMAPAHAHLNLLGFVQMSIFGTFYALAAGKYSEQLAKLNFALSNLAVLIMIPVLVVILSGGDGDPPLPLIIAIRIGEVLAVSGMIVFLIQVLKVRKAS